MVPPVMTSASGVDGVRDGKPPGARGGIQILGMVRGEWLRLAPQAYGRGAGCWVIAGTWPPPRRVSGSQVVVRVLMLAWIFAFVVFRALAAPIAVVMVAESGFFNVLASVRELAALTAGYFGACSASSWLRFSSGGRQGWELGIPQPFRGCRIDCRSLRVCAAVLGSLWSGAWHPPA